MSAKFKGIYIFGGYNAREVGRAAQEVVLVRI
jgi:hypothetical protein